MALELASSSSGLNLDNHLLLEQPLLRVPYELHRRTHKSAQRSLEHDKDWLTAKLKSTLKSADPAHTASTLSSIDDMIRRMETLKRKLSSLSADEQNLHKQSRARIEHVQKLEGMHSAADVKYDEWSKVRLNRLLVDYLLRSGYVETAQKLAKNQNIEDLVDIDAFVNCQRIETSLKRGETKDALAWCADNKQALKKMGSEVEYELRLQEYIELVRTREAPKMQQATLHARKYLTPSENTEFSIRAAGLLAYGTNTVIEPYKSFYASSRWEYLASLFLKTYHQLLALPQSPPLHIALSAGLSALKTPSCHSSHMSPSGALNANTIPVPGSGAISSTHSTKAAAMGQSVCPICSTELNALARNVPYAHHSKSLVDNDLVVLPNGRVYGRDRLMAFQSKVRGGAGVGVGAVVRAGDREEEGAFEDVIDPADVEERFKSWEMKKVYIS